MEEKMEHRGFKEILRHLPQRLASLIWKCISWKGLLLAATIYMIIKEYIPAATTPYVWLGVFLLIVFDKKGLDVIKHLKK